MKAQAETISPVRTRLSVEIPPDQVAREEESVLADLRREVTIPGFRKGKAPISSLRKLYGARVRSDVIGRLIEKSYVEALQNEGIFPVSDPDIKLQSAATEGALAYTAVIETRPKVEPRGYKNLALEKVRTVVDAVEVQSRLEALRVERASYEPAPEGREAATGDMVVMDYVGAIDGTEFEGGKGQDRSVILGSGMLVPGFEEGLEGIRTGEEREIEVSFPADYQAEQLAGKKAGFQVNVKEIKLRRLPELDDDFAKEVSEVENIEALRGRIRDGIHEEKRLRHERKFREQVIDDLLEANPFEVPQSMVSRQQSHSLERLKNELAHRGLDPEALGIGEPGVQEDHRRAAERAVRWAFLLNAIADAEDMKVTDEDVEQRIAAIAEADGRPLDNIRSFFAEGDRMDGLRSSMLERKVIDYVVEHSTVTEVDPATTAEEGDGE